MLKKFTYLLECNTCYSMHVVEDRVVDAWGESHCPYCNHTHFTTTNSEVAYDFWSVASYDTDQAYVGPEEGGWWYTEGIISDYGKIKIFDNFKKATKYHDKLIKKGYYTLGFNDSFPTTHFPLVRPRYC